MKITAISAQARDKNRVNISVDGKYRFSLDVFQLVDLGIKIGSDYSEEELINFEQESQFGKVYSRALEYCLSRPHSAKEVKDYLYRKTIAKRTKTGEQKTGVPKSITARVFDRLVEKNYINDTNFARFWVENRSLKKGVSFRKLKTELAAKGVNSQIIEQILGETDRSDDDELKKVIAKKRSRYPDDQKFMAYLLRLGFNYEDIKQALAAND